MRTVLFPGQGAQFKGMGKELFPMYPQPPRFSAIRLRHCVWKTERINFGIRSILSPPCML
jgi:malonyl CoA-acyl carrier protein transacylase